MVAFYSIILCFIAKLFGSTLFCPKEDTPAAPTTGAPTSAPVVAPPPCEDGTRSASFLLSASDNKAAFDASFYCTDNAQVDFDTFSNTPTDLSTITTPITLVTASVASGCSVDADEETVKCSTSSPLEVTVCCQDSDSGLNASVLSDRDSDSAAAPNLFVDTSDDTDEIFFVDISDMSLSDDAPAGCSVGEVQYSCNFDGDLEFNKAYVRF